MQNLQAFEEYISEPRNVVIVTHVKPDADALGSSLGLSAYLKKKKHNVTVITPSDYPEFLDWMPGNKDVVVFQKEKPGPCETLIQQSDLIFCLDFSTLNRINELGEMVRNASAKKALIDHHLEPENFADFIKWDDGAASTAQLIYLLIKELGDVDMIDADMADCLYAGILTDTGGFRHSNTNYTVLHIASELVRQGANPYSVSKLVYETNSLERLRLLGFVLSEKLKVLPEYNTAYMVLNADELKRFASQTGDTEGLVNYGLSIKGIRLSVMITDRKDSVRLSLRSLGNFSVNDLARKHFEGGGHRNAAGGQSNLTAEETLQKFLSILPEYKDPLTKADN